MEGDDRGVGRRARAAVAEREGDEEVEAEPRVAEREGRRAVAEERAEQREVGAREQPGVQRLGPPEPVGAQLREAREHVHHAELRADEPDHPRRDGGARARRVAPRVEGERRARREQREPEREQRDQVVVVEVVGLIEQLDVGEREREGEGARAGAPAEREAERRGAHQREDGVHAGGRQRAHPAEAHVGEVVAGGDVEGGDPAARGEAHHAREHHQPEERAEGRERGDVDGRFEPGAQTAEHRRAVSRRRCC
ncbi:MAG: hypothetical protein JWM10_5084 [Myxococcaceae bacterium]|nr:hypothetical protein [Myxococcaceae bacterium]